MKRFELEWIASTNGGKQILYFTEAELALMRQYSKEKFEEYVRKCLDRVGPHELRAVQSKDGFRDFVDFIRDSE